MPQAAGPYTSAVLVGAPTVAGPPWPPPGGAGHGAWHPTQGLESRDHRVQTPGVDVRVACLFEPLEAVAVVGDGAAICWQDEVLHRGGPDDRGAPPEGGWPPMGPTGGAAIVAEQDGCETTWGVLAIAEGVCTCAGEIAQGCLLAPGDSDRRASP
jgi:hypothetical protein